MIFQSHYNKATVEEWIFAEVGFIYLWIFQF